VGDPIAAAPEVVHLIDPHGEVVQVPADQASAASDLGYVPASPKQVEDYQTAKAEQERLGGAMGQVSSGILSGARAMSFGLSDQALVAGGVSAQELEALKAINPGASMAGTVAGIAIPTLLSGGAAGAAEGAGEGGVLAGARTAAKYTAPALVSRAGRAVESGVAKLLPEADTLAGRLATSALTKGAGSAVEGAAYGLGNVVSEQALGDPNLTAQSAIAEIGLSALLGGGLGGLGGAVDVGLPAAVSKAKDAIGDVLSKARGGFEKAYPEIASKLTGVDADTISQLLARRADVIRDPEARIKLAEEVAGGLQKQYDAVEDALRTANKRFRPEETERLATKHLGLSDSDVEAEVARLRGRIDSTVKEMQSKPELYPQMYPTKLELIRDGLERDTASATPAEAFGAINSAKQEIDAQLGKFGKTIDPLHQDAISAIRGLRGEIKDSLTDPKIWGDAGVRQAAFNDAQSEYFTTLKDMRGAKGLMRKVTTKSGSVAYEVDPVKVQTYLNQMADPRGQLRSQMLDRFSAASSKVVDEIENTAKNAPTAVFDRGSVDSLISKQAGAIAEARKQASVTQLMNQLEPRMSWGSLPISSGGKHSALGALGEIAGGGIMGGAPGAALGAMHSVYEAAKDVPRAVATLARLERMSQSVSRQIDTAASVLARGSVKASYVGRGEVSAGLARTFGRSLEDAQKVYTKKRNEVNRLASNPAAMQEALEKQTEGWHEHAPQTAQAVQIASARGIAFLASKAPAHPKAGPLSPEWKPSGSEIARFERYHEAVQHPATVLKQAAAGTLTPEAVEAVRTVYPDLYARFSDKIVERLSLTKDPPYHARLMSSLLLGRDLDGSLSPTAFQANQQTLAGPSAKSSENQAGPIKPTAGGAGKITLSSRLETDAQSAQRRSRQ
jgi:hypothetical protein